MWSEKTRKLNKTRNGGIPPVIYQNKFEDNLSLAFIPKRKYAEKALQLITLCLRMYPATYRNLDNGGIYTGASGLAYALLHMIKSGVLKEHETMLKEESLRLGETAYAYCRRGTDEGDVVSFFFGKGGIYAICAAIFRLNEREMKAMDCVQRFVHGQWVCKDINFSMTGGDDIANGRAGYVVALLWLYKFFSANEIRIYSLYNILLVILDAGRLARSKLANGSKFVESTFDTTCTSPLIYTNMGSRYLGTLMGLTGILRSLLMCPFYLEEQKQADKEVREAVDFILSLQSSDGSFPDKLEDVAKLQKSYESHAQWKTGAGGICSLMAAAYLRWNDPKYLNACFACCEFTWKYGLSKECFGLGNGITGSCYLFLLMYRLTKEEKYLNRALQFTDFMISEKYMGPMMTERNCVEDFSLMEGLAGVAVLLVDLLNPNEAEFPFFPVFKPIMRI